MSVPQIPGFRIQKLLSEGRRSVLYMAEQQSLQRPVALKILTGEMSGDEQSRKRLIEQEKSAARLTHPNILAVFDIGENEGRYYIATEYVTGGTLRERLNNKNVSPEQALAITRDLAQGLSFLHEQGFLHRDVKPSNILFREDSTAVLGDTGITRMEDAAQMEVSFGSPHYMSPEQAQSQPCDGRSDLYSLGVVLFEMLTGRTPFDADDPFQVAIKHISEPPPPLPAPLAKLQPLVTRLLAKTAPERFSSAAQLVTVLEQALSKLSPRQQPAAPQATTQMPAQADPRATVVAAPIDPRATMIVPPAATADPRATMVVPPAPVVDPRATVVAAPIDPRATVVAAPIDPRATVVAAPVAPIDPGATTVQPAVGERIPPPMPATDNATVVNVPPPIPMPAFTEDPTTVRMATAADPSGSGHLIHSAEPRRFEVPRFSEEQPKSRAWIWILLVLLLGGGGFAGWWFFLRDKPPPVIRTGDVSQLGGTATSAPAGATPAEVQKLIAKAQEMGRQGSWVAADGESAVSVLQSAFELAPDSPEVRKARQDQLGSVVGAIRAAIDDGKITTASGILEEALKAYPEDPALAALKSEVDGL